MHAGNGCLYVMTCERFAGTTQPAMNKEKLNVQPFGLKKKHQFLGVYHVSLYRATVVAESWRCMFAGRQQDAELWARKVRPGDNEVVLLPVEATRLYLDLRPFMNVAPLAVRSVTLSCGHSLLLLACCLLPVALPIAMPVLADSAF